MGYPNVIFVEEEEGGQVGVGRAHLDEAPKHAAAVTIITLGAAARVGVALAGDEGQLSRARLLRVLQGPHLPS